MSPCDTRAFFLASIMLEIFRVPPIISGKGKATDFKFGQYIQWIHPTKIP